MTRIFAFILTLSFATAAASEKCFPFCDTSTWKTAEVKCLALCSEYFWETANAADVRALIEQGRDVNAKKDGWTPLHYAALLGTPEFVKILLEAGADMTDTGPSMSETPFHTAAANTQSRFSALILGGYRPVNITKDLQTAALQRAAEASPETLRVMLQAGFDVDFEVEWAALHYAVSAQNIPAINALIEAGADVNAGNASAPIHMAAELADPEIIEILLGAGASVDAVDNRYGQAPLAYVIREHRPRFVDDTAERLTLDSVNLLLQAGANPHITFGENCNSLLDLAIQSAPTINQFNRGYINGSVEDSREIVSLLIEEGLDPAATSAIGDTPLHHAAAGNDIEILKMLLQIGVDVNARNDEGNTPLHIAAGLRSDYPRYLPNGEAVRLLLEASAEVNPVNILGEIPLRSAIRGNRFARSDISEAVQTLLDAGADVKSISNDASTPLHDAVRYNELELVRAILARGADVNAQDSEGRTPLHVSRRSWGFQKTIAALLVSAGADETIADIDGTTNEGLLQSVRVMKGANVSVEYVGRCPESLAGCVSVEKSGQD